jgi:peptide/nickel transport system ATP-binding protein
MKSLNESQGLAYLYITHDLAGARYVASRILVMYAGEIVEEGPEAAIVDEPKHPYTQLLVAAAPDPDQRGVRQDQSVFRGEPPNLGLDIPGCPFQFRCPAVHDRCRTTHPEMTALPDGHAVRCHLYTA